MAKQSKLVLKNLPEINFDVRVVPADFVHPTDDAGVFTPMYPPRALPMLRCQAPEKVDLSEFLAYQTQGLDDDYKFVLYTNFGKATPVTVEGIVLEARDLEDLAEQMIQCGIIPEFFEVEEYEEWIIHMCVINKHIFELFGAL